MLQHTERQIDELEERATDAEEELAARRENMARMLEGLEKAHSKVVEKLKTKVRTLGKRMEEDVVSFRGRDEAMRKEMDDMEKKLEEGRSEVEKLQV